LKNFRVLRVTIENHKCKEGSLLQKRSVGLCQSVSVKKAVQILVVGGANNDGIELEKKSYPFFLFKILSFQNFNLNMFF
jgi:hypothetical protein